MAKLGLFVGLYDYDHFSPDDKLATLRLGQEDIPRNPSAPFVKQYEMEITEKGRKYYSSTIARLRGDAGEAEPCLITLRLHGRNCGNAELSRTLQGESILAQAEEGNVAAMLELMCFFKSGIGAYKKDAEAYQHWRREAIIRNHYPSMILLLQEDGVEAVDRLRADSEVPPTVRDTLLGLLGKHMYATDDMEKALFFFDQVENPASLAQTPAAAAYAFLRFSVEDSYSSGNPLEVHVPDPYRSVLKGYLMAENSCDSDNSAVHRALELFGSATRALQRVGKKIQQGKVDEVEVHKRLYVSSMNLAAHFFEERHERLRGADVDGVVTLSERLHNWIQEYAGLVYQLAPPHTVAERGRSGELLFRLCTFGHKTWMAWEDPYYFERASDPRLSQLPRAGEKSKPPGALEQYRQKRKQELAERAKHFDAQVATHNLDPTEIPGRSRHIGQYG